MPMRHTQTIQNNINRLCALVRARIIFFCFPAMAFAKAYIYIIIVIIIVIIITTIITYVIIAIIV